MARRLVVKRGKKIGAAPGTLVHIGDHGAFESVLSLMVYDENQLQSHEGITTAQCQALIGQHGVKWLNMYGVHQACSVQALGEIFGLHPLVLEDILNTDQRPKVEDYEGYLYIVLRMLRFDESRQQIHSEQVSLILGQDYVLSMQEKPGDVFQGLRERIQSGRRIRFMQADYLAYAILDSVVDHYFVLLEKLGDEIEALEDELLIKPEPGTLQRIHHFKREMLMLRKAVWPLREVLSQLARDDHPLISKETRLFMRDVYDHSIHVIDTIDTLRDLLASMLELYLSSINNKMNEVMKVLTIIATLFMPLTFIAGIYGMNFEYMPELVWRWGYPSVWLVMLLVASGLLLLFRRRGWL
ncbi:MAG: magnesium transporter [Halopseudomonas sp.]|jgi:magnesium transporter|uniref:magnesium/cobalt transporter CorA n=1 Tax=Halopseudomonas sp. TaxID=2901191 RepID=UPI0039E5B51A